MDRAVDRAAVARDLLNRRSDWEKDVRDVLGRAYDEAKDTGGGQPLTLPLQRQFEAIRRKYEGELASTLSNHGFGNVRWLWTWGLTNAERVSGAVIHGAGEAREEENPRPLLDRIIDRWLHGPPKSRDERLDAGIESLVDELTRIAERG